MVNTIAKSAVLKIKHYMRNNFLNADIFNFSGELIKVLG